MRRDTAFGLALLMVSTFGCEWLGRKATEKVIGAATGSEVELGKDKMVIKSKEGEVTFQGDGESGKMVIKSDKGEAVFEGDGEEATVKTDDGTELHMSQTAPKDFPLPLPDGATILQSTDVKSDKEGHVQVVATKVSGKSVADLAKVYESALKEKGFEVSKTEMNMGEMNMSVFAAKKEGIEASVQIVANAGEPDVTVNLTWKSNP